MSRYDDVALRRRPSRYSSSSSCRKANGSLRGGNSTAPAAGGLPHTGAMPRPSIWSSTFCTAVAWSHPFTRYRSTPASRRCRPRGRRRWRTAIAAGRPGTCSPALRGTRTARCGRKGDHARAVRGGGHGGCHGGGAGRDSRRPGDQLNGRRGGGPPPAHPVAARQAMTAATTAFRRARWIMDASRTVEYAPVPGRRVETIYARRSFLSRPAPASRPGRLSPARPCSR